MCPPGAARTVPLERFLGPEQLNAVNSQNLCRNVREGNPRGRSKCLLGRAWRTPLSLSIGLCEAIRRDTTGPTRGQ